jgi:hypothetical protein
MVKWISLASTLGAIGSDCNSVDGPDGGFADPLEEHSMAKTSAVQEGNKMKSGRGPQVVASSLFRLRETRQAIPDDQMRRRTK